MRYTLEINIGFLWFSQMRDVLRSYAWNDASFDWQESRGWLDKTFYIKGSREDVVALASRFDGWCSKPVKKEN